MQLLDRNLTKGLVDAIRYMISPGIVIPVLLLLLLTIYFLFALVRGLREANTDLTKQLLHVSLFSSRVRFARQCLI